MGPFDLFGIIVESILGVPAHLIAAYEQNTDLWNLVRPMMVALLVLGWSAKRTRRGAP